ncbi:hypothetical protein [Mariniblastus fucicola]|nr:hypothetical protein [Mariniblastus fucicola]
MQTKRVMRTLPALMISLSISLSFAVSNSQAQSIIGALADDGPTETIELTVSPAASPSPAFKYRLTVLPHQTISGNAASTYMRSLAEGGLRSPLKRISDKFGLESHSWYDSQQFKDVAPEKILEASAEFDDYVREYLARATMQRDCDFDLGMEDLQGERAIGFSLSFEQETRSMSRVLGLQTRAAIIEGRFADAVALMRMNYQLAQNVAQTPALVAGLIGIAEVGITNHGMEQLIAAEGSPNMYWALTELPRPIIDLRRAMRLEMQWGERLIPELAEAQQEHTDQEWNSLLNKISGRFADGMLFAQVQNGPSGVAERKPVPQDAMMATALGLASYRSAKKRLIAGGETKDNVEAMSVSEVLMKDAARELTRISDFAEKEIYLPYPQSANRLDRVEDFLIGEEKRNSPGAIFASMILPAAIQVRRAQLRVDRNICALRAIEALRMHVAETGVLPSSLDEINIVPVPDNPATGKPFRYRLKDGAAVLDLPRDGLNLYWKRYVIRLR